MIIEDILVDAGVDYRPMQGRPDEVILCCPFCIDAGFSEDTKGHFGLNIENGKGHCFRCDWRSRSAVYTAKALCRVYALDFTWRLRLSASAAEERVAQAKPEPAALPVGLPSGYESFRDLDDEIERKAFDYATSRGISRQEIADYKLGFAAVGDFTWRLIFPVIGDDGKVYGCAGRDFSGQSKLKYRNTDGIKLLYNGQHKAKTAVVVEGPMDVLAVNRVLKAHFSGMVAVGALGSVVTPQQIAQLAKYDRIINFPDWDVPGLKGAIKRADVCTEAGLSTMVVEPDFMNGDDPGSMDTAMIARCIRSAKPWSKAEKLRMRLRALK